MTITAMAGTSTYISVQQRKNGDMPSDTCSARRSTMQATTVPWTEENIGVTHHAETSRASFFTLLSAAWQQLRQALPAGKRHAASPYVMLIESDIPEHMRGLLP